MHRRPLLRAAALAPLLARPALAQPAGARTLRFIPQSDLAVVDPVVTTAYVTRNHAFLVWDTLYGIDAEFRPQPQMAAGHTVEDEGKRWTIRLRSGLKFHDGEPVRARDAVASIRRWAQRDPMGQEILARLDELAAPDDSSIVFRLKRPFPLLLSALAKPSTPVCFIMPERLARTEPTTQIRELIGSGPYRFKADERVPGSRVVYERFADYAPRTDGTAEWTAGPKRAHLDRVEWHVTPDPATASAALERGEVDWWEVPLADLLPQLRRNRNVVLDTQDPTGLMAVGRFNSLHPPFDNPGVRRALLGAINQADFMTAVIGEDRSLWREGVGFFPPDTALANDAGLEAITSPRNLEAVKRAVTAAGYKGERVVLLGATDFPTLNALGQVGNAMLRAAGLNVDFVATDWGTVVQRRASREPPERGGWSMFFTFWSGLDCINPGVNQTLRGNGTAGWFGWATSPRLEALRGAWFDAEDLPAQQRIARELQTAAFEEAPTLPLGQYFQSTAYRRNIADVPKGFPIFWNVRKAA